MLNKYFETFCEQAKYLIDFYKESLEELKKDPNTTVEMRLAILCFSKVFDDLALKCAMRKVTRDDIDEMLNRIFLAESVYGAASDTLLHLEKGCQPDGIKTVNCPSDIISALATGVANTIGEIYDDREMWSLQEEEELEDE